MTVICTGIKAVVGAAVGVIDGVVVGGKVVDVVTGGEVWMTVVGMDVVVEVVSVMD